MLSYFLFFAAVWGLCAGIAFSHLTVGVRAWAGEGWLGKFLGCPMCIGWHVGWIGVATGIAPGERNVFSALLLAFACAGINLLLSIYVEKGS
jgi:hypothetical protein